MRGEDLLDDDAPSLDLDALLARDLTEAQALAVLQGSSCVSEQELADRLGLLRREGRHS
jgi:hypothetical protein